MEDQPQAFKTGQHLRSSEIGRLGEIDLASVLFGPGDGWVHEIKHDGYRLIVRRDGKVVRPPLLDHIVRMAERIGTSFAVNGPRIC